MPWAWDPDAGEAERADLWSSLASHSDLVRVFQTVGDYKEKNEKKRD